MHHSTLIVYTLADKLERKAYETNKGKLLSCLPALADLLNALKYSREIKILIFVPHCLAEEKELSNPLDMVERIREMVRIATRSSKVGNIPLDGIFRREMGKPLMSIVRVIPMECLGQRRIGKRQVVFEGNVLWISLRETLEILDELKELTPPRKILLDLTGAGLYQLPALTSAKISGSITPETSIELKYWNDDGPSLEEGRSPPGVRNLLLMEDMVRDIFKGRLGDLIDLLQHITPSVDLESELGSKVLNQLIFLLGAACGIKAPLLPLAHLSILEIASSDLPKILDPGDLKTNVKLTKLEKWIVRYSYEASGIEISPVEAFILLILSIAKERLNDLGLIPSRDEFEFKIPGLRKVRLVRMSWDWIEAVVDLMDELHAIPQLVTLCMQFNGLLDQCKDLLGEIRVRGLNYGELAAKAEEEKPLVLTKEYPKEIEQSIARKIKDKHNSIIKNPSLIVEDLDELRVHAGLLPPMVYLAHKHERGIDLLYIRELVEEFLNLNIMRKICGHSNVLKVH